VSAIANGLFEVVVVGVREVLGRGVRDFHQLVPTLRRVPMNQELVDDLAGMMPAREKEQDFALLGLEVDAGRVDPGPDVLRRLTQRLQGGELGSDLFLHLDDHRACIVDPHCDGVADPLPLEGLVEWKQQVRALVGERPLVRVGHG
jgi:hypothetical protein